MCTDQPKQKGSHLSCRSPTHRFPSACPLITTSSTCTISLAATVLILLLSICPQSTTAQSLAAVTQKLKIPDFIPITSSTGNMKVELNNNNIKPGDSVPARNFRLLNMMTGISWDAYEGYQYTVMLLDLDTNGTSVRNLFTAINVPSSKIPAGQTPVAYDAPSVPCHTSTKHRLVMLAFRQEQTIDLADFAYLSSPPGPSPRRENIKLNDIINRHRLTLEAANVFLAVGEVNGICSASSNLYPNSLLTLSSITVVMVMLHQMLWAKQQ